MMRLVIDKRKWGPNHPIFSTHQWQEILKNLREEGKCGGQNKFQHPLSLSPPFDHGALFILASIYGRGRVLLDANQESWDFEPLN